MQVKYRKWAAVLFASLFAGAFVGPAFADPPLHPKAPCNSGNGNGSETTPANDCDPGNSGGNNSGGD
jgi:hypothetical protein